jgi:hypothetical protein
MTIRFIERIVYLFLVCPSALLSLYPYDETDGRICDTRGALPCLRGRQWSIRGQAFSYGG